MADNRHLFAEFAAAEKAVGGPDSHLAAAVWVAQRLPDPEWFLGLYTCVYNVPSAEVLYARWPCRREVTRKDAEWLWPNIKIRKERVVNGFGPVKLSEALTSYYEYLMTGLTATERETSYDTAWKDLTSQVQHHGRYFGSKLYECLYRLRNQLPAATDMRPNGGRLSRKGLTLIFPDHDPKASLSEPEANHLANEIRAACRLTWFEVEVLLCNFRQAMGGHQYPGRGLDSELGHYDTVREMNPDTTFWLPVARSHLFPARALGEMSGWPGRRQELSRTMCDYDYVWSDLKYDYLRTTDLRKPVKW